MKRISLLLTVFFFALVAPTSAQTEKPISIGTSYKLESRHYKSAREINVWLPPSYDKGTTNYPVVYLVDGGVAQDFHHISGLAQLGSINHNYEELIVVGIKTENRYMELTHEPNDSRYISKPARAGKSALFMKYIETEVIPFVEAKYRNSSRRVLMGESLAGLFVAEVFLKRPEMFTDFVSVSPSLWWDDKNLAKKSPELIGKHDSKERRLYITMANEGGTMQNGLDMILSAIKKDKPKGLKMKYVDRRKTETHATIYHGAALDAFRWLFGKPPVDYGKTPWYLIEGGQPDGN